MTEDRALQIVCLVLPSVGRLPYLSNQPGNHEADNLIVDNKEEILFCHVSVITENVEHINKNKTNKIALNIIIV